MLVLVSRLRRLIDLKFVHGVGSLMTAPSVAEPPPVPKHMLILYNGVIILIHFIECFYNFNSCFYYF